MEWNINTVTRALSMIEIGGLDESDMASLAARLGVGSRQLRRLFHQHLGASPSMVSQTRRILLAKQLIHETRLPMTEITFASGFRSIRRFNEVFHSVFGCAPSALRKSRLPEIAIASAGSIRLALRFRPPYDWDQMLKFLGDRAISGMERVIERRYERTIQLDGVHGVIGVERASEDSLGLAVRFPKLSALPRIIARVRRVFDLDADPRLIAEHLETEPTISPLVQRRPGLRVPGAWDGFELANRAVLGQQITVTAAVKLAAKLVRTYGEQLAEPTDGLTHVFPPPDVLANADLKTLGMPGTRANTLTAVANVARAVPGFFDLNCELDEAVSRFRTVCGIGEWTAQYIALRQLREPDAFPAADVGLIRAMHQLTGREFSASGLLEHANRWRPWRAYAAQHLWTMD